MSAELQPLVTLLQNSLDPQQHRQAEGQIQQAEGQQGFSIALLRIVGTDEIPQTTRLAAALYFKNLVRRRWVDDQGNYVLPQDEVAQIKHDIVGLMIACPPNIQAQLGEAISEIANTDFFRQWDSLIDDLVSRLAPENPVTTDGVLKVAHSIFKRWRPLMRSDELFTEINHVLDRFTQPFLNLLSSTDAAIMNASNKTQLQQHFTVLNTSVKVLHDLTCQDIPDAIEPHLGSIIGLLDKYLKYENKQLQEEDEASVVEFVKAATFGLLTLWATKYEDDVSKYISGLTLTSWNLLTGLTQDTKYDILASRGMNFLTSVSASPNHSGTFNDQNALQQIIEKIILPNITLREADEELFEDEPIEYIRRDLEGADNDTRRRAATDFLRRLMQTFRQAVTTVTMGHIQSFLQSYGVNRKDRWKAKDTAVYLFCSIAAVGSVTQASGVKSTNEYVDVIAFFQQYIAEDLTASDPAHAIIQVDAIKFLYTFRNQLTQEQWQQALPMVVRHLGSKNYVVHTYSAIAIERTLFLSDENKQPKISRTTISPLSKDILTQLFKLISASTAPEKVQENEFLIRCLMRVLIVIREDVVPLTDFLITSFTNIIRIIRHNPSNPRFYYFLFESVGALIRFAAPSQPEKLENALFDPFSTILTEGINEFMPYVFQLFAALLEANPSATLSDYYKNLVQPILSANLWETRGNTPALTRLLCALITRGSQHIVANNQLEPILGLFQRLISSKSSESYGFDVLETLILHVSAPSLQQYWPTIFQLLFTRLSSSKTDNFALRFTRLYHLMSTRDSPEQGLGADFICEAAEAVQPNTFTPLYLQIILPESQKLTRPIDRKTAIVSFTKTLANSRAFAERYAKGWGFTAEALLALMTSAPVVTRDADDAIMEQDTEDVSFGVGFTALSTVRRPPSDPCADVVDVRSWVREYLTAAAKTTPKLGTFIQERLSEQVRSAFAALMAS